MVIFELNPLTFGGNRVIPQFQLLEQLLKERDSFSGSECLSMVKVEGGRVAAPQKPRLEKQRTQRKIQCCGSQ